jgi:hypothetical protein
MPLELAAMEKEANGRIKTWTKVGATSPQFFK